MSIKEDIPMEKISELLKKAPTDDGTFYGSLYDLYVFPIKSELRKYCGKL